MAENYIINSQVILDKAQQLQQIITKLEDIYAQIKVLFNETIQPSVWHSLAAESMQEEFELLSKQFPNYCTNIKNLIKFMQDRAIQFDEGMNQIAKSLEF